MLPLLPGPPAGRYQAQDEGGGRRQLRGQPGVAAGGRHQLPGRGHLLHPLAQALLELGQGLVGGAGRRLEQARQDVGAARAGQGVRLHAVLGRRGQRARRILAQQCHGQVRAGRGGSVQQRVGGQHG
jgi:hypothetical protein